MAKAIVTLSTNTALVLTTVEVGIYVKGKALLASDRRAFCLADLGKDKEQHRIALSTLLKIGLVVHKGGGWYALAKVPARASAIEPKLGLGRGMTTAIAKKPSAPQSLSVELRNALRAKAKKLFGFGLPRSVYSMSTGASKARYKRMVKAIDRIGSTVEEFARFVFWQDWSWMRGRYPSLGYISTDDFLGKFEWYKEHENDIVQTQRILELYDKAFRLTGEHKYEDHLSILQLRTTLEAQNVTPEQFIDYASSRNWRSFDGVPSIKFLISDAFIAQCCSVLKTRIIGETESKAYLERILDRLARISLPIASENFEDYNWMIGEAVFEPLVSFANNPNSQLGQLVQKVVTEKDTPALGFYLIAYDGRLTPLAVYWIVFARKYLGDSFYSRSNSWKDVLKGAVTDAVDLAILEADL